MSVSLSACFLALSDARQATMATMRLNHAARLRRTVRFVATSAAALLSRESRFLSENGDPPCLHRNARGLGTTKTRIYPGSTIHRHPVDDQHVFWRTPLDRYDPPEYTSPVVLGDNAGGNTGAARPAWADPPSTANIAFNTLDGAVERRSYHGTYMVTVDNIPLNPFGRTGLRGRGLLGRWGPNFAADPIVTRWKRDDAGDKMKDVDGNPILQVVLIRRSDNGQWALPGGMVDAGESVAVTAKREFYEEALDGLNLPDSQRSAVETVLSRIFHLDEAASCIVYSGYVDDPRNTDNAWVESVAFNFHDELGDAVAKLELKAGDDAAEVKWSDVLPEMHLYGSHRHFVETVLRRLSKVLP